MSASVKSPNLRMGPLLYNLRPGLRCQTYDSSLALKLHPKEGERDRMVLNGANEGRRPGNGEPALLKREVFCAQGFSGGQETRLDNPPRRVHLYWLCSLWWSLRGRVRLKLGL